MAVLQHVSRRCTASAPHAAGARVDLLLVADMVEPRLARARCRLRRRRPAAASRDTPGVDGRGIELSREGVNECVAKGLAVIQGDADTDLVDYPDDAFDYVILSQTLQATRSRSVGARAHAAHRPARHRLIPQFRPLADPPAAPVRRPHAGHRQPAATLVRHAEHPFLHDPRFRRPLRRDRRQDGEGGGARAMRQAAPRSTRPGGSGTCSASRPCFC